MARNLAIKHIRTTKANLDSQASASGLNQGEIYLITNEDRIAIGLSSTTYETFAKESEAGGGSSLNINALTAKTTPVDADITVIEDSAASWAQKKLSWANIKATLKTYFDTLYATIAQATGVIGINSQTGTTYTLVLTDAGKLVRCNNASAITLTVPPNSSVAFPVNTVITVEQQGAGQITVTPGSGVTCNAFDGLLSAGQYAGLSLVKVSTDVWTVFGGISA